MMRMHRRAQLALLAGLVGCSGGSDAKTPTGPGDDPVQPTPANIVIVDTPQFRSEDNTYLIMTLHLRNTGGPGVYGVEVWRWGSGPGAEDILSTSTEQVEVAAGYEETPSWRVFSPVTGTPIKYILVFSRDQGSAVSRVSWRCDYDFGVNTEVKCGSGSSP